MLGAVLHEQHKYVEAERLLRHTVQQREKVLGAEQMETLDSTYWLARTLYEQQKYVEVVRILRQVVQRWNKVLGTELVYTLDSIYWIALTLYRQQSYAEAEQLLRQSHQQREKVYGTDHFKFFDSEHLLQDIRRELTQSTRATHVTETARSRLDDFFAEGPQRQTTYADSEIQQVSMLLSHVNPQWRKVPRTYIALRTIDCLELLDNFIDLGFSDHWFPVTERILPHYLQPSWRSRFVAAQSLVMTKSMDLEKGGNGQHRHFQQHEPLPFEKKGILGSSGFTQVDRVLSLISFREYARKRVERNTVFSGRKTDAV
jgi:hypothetical protein